MSAGVAYRPPSEADLDGAFDLLESMRARVRENLALQRRDPEQARVLTIAWRDELALRGIGRARFERIVDELLRRDQVRVDGPFIEPIGGPGR